MSFSIWYLCSWAGYHRASFEESDILLTIYTASWLDVFRQRLQRRQIARHLQEVLRTRYHQFHGRFPSFQHQARSIPILGTLFHRSGGRWSRNVTGDVTWLWRFVRDLPLRVDYQFKRHELLAKHRDGVGNAIPLDSMHSSFIHPNPLREVAGLHYTRLVVFDVIKLSPESLIHCAVPLEI